MNILIKYKNQSEIVEDIDNKDISIGTIKFAVLNMILRRLNLPREPKFKDFEVEVDHPDDDTNDYLKKEIKKILHDLYW